MGRGVVGKSVGLAGRLEIRLQCSMVMLRIRDFLSSYRVMVLSQDVYSVF